MPILVAEQLRLTKLDQCNLDRFSNSLRRLDVLAVDKKLCMKYCRVFILTEMISSVVAGARIEQTYDGRLCPLANSTIYYKK